MRLLCCFLILSASAFGQSSTRVPSDWQAAMNRIRPESVRGHVSFLASDLLEGRGTPSRGLDIAAEYIASQFRRAGLDPLPGGSSYFQPLSGQKQVMPDAEPVECVIHVPGAAAPQRVTGLAFSLDGIDIDREPILETSAPKVAASEAVILYRSPSDDAQESFKELAANQARLTIVVDPAGGLARRIVRSRAFPADRESSLPKGRWLFVPSFPTGLPADARVSVRARPVAVTAAGSRNVVGILRGSDPALADTYLVVSAHYDHVGMDPFGSGDRIYNGANDDASGVTGLIEIAEALSKLPERPKRSIIFAAFAGEESGLLGAREFVRNPPVPLSRIVGNLNMEHLGRPDSDGIDARGKGSITGFTFSSITQALVDAGKLSGTEVYRHEKYSDDFFNASDNAAFAQKGIPAHTICNGFLFAEYHQQGDHWEKIDADNLARLARTIALGVLTLADDARAPQWNEAEEKTAKYREAAKGLEGKD